MNIISLLNSREIKLSGPFPPGQLMLEQMTAKEAVGEPFEFELDVLSAVSWLDHEKLLGKPMTVELEIGDGSHRYFNGYVAQLAQLGRASDATRFRLSLRPWLWMLRHTSRSRIFQEMTALEVIETILREHGIPFEKRLGGGTTYQKWEYLVQYRESDLNFVARLMEQVGLYYFFQHDAEKHLLILADPPTTLPALPGYAEVPLYPPGENQRRKRDHLDAWTHSWRVVPGRYNSRDFDFKNPKGDLNVVLAAPKAHDHAKYEVYDHPGEYVQRADGEQHVRKQLEALQVPHAMVEGGGTARGLTAGSLLRVLDFDFGGAADVKKQYMILQSSYTITLNSYGSGGGGPALDCRCTFLALDSEIPYRSPAPPMKPTVLGPQTATVVGKAGEEIWTDKYGRVKVQFHWDREGKSDENSSCWVRVSQAWAGGGWGAMHIPRIGQEVIVDFLEGDPDRPIITGRVYNGDNMPPYELPANQTRSGIKSRSTKGGTADNANEIRFEDKKGSEELYLQAEKDQNTLVKNDQGITVKKNRTVTVGGNETITVSGTRTTTVTKKDTVTLQDEHELTVTKKVKETFNAEHELAVVGPQKITVDKDKTEHVKLAYELTTDKKFNLQQGGTKLTFEGNKVALDAASVITITRGPAKMSLDDAGKVVISTPTGIAFECGANKITITPSGIEISAMNVQVKAAASSFQVSPEGVHTNGSMVNVTATGICSIKGLGTLKLNS